MLVKMMKVVKIVMVVMVFRMLMVASRTSLVRLMLPSDGSDGDGDGEC